MPTPYERLREIINSKFPDRLKLGFGVEVMPDLTKNKFAGKAVGTIIYSGSYGKKIQFPMSTVTYKSALILERFVVLGKPVTLADIFRTIEQVHPHYFSVDCDGRLNADNWNTICFLPLALPVSEWPDETLEAIIKLIE